MRRHLLLTGLLIWQSSANADPKTSTTTGLDYDAASLCPSTTLNYVTQTLPQQCLRTDWSRPGANSTTSSTMASNSHEPSSHSQGPSDDAVTFTAPPRPPSFAYEDQGNVDNNPERQPGPSPTTTEVHTSTETQSFTIPTPAAEDEDEGGDPLSDHSNFLSFEEWKAQMLEQAGQSPDHVVGAASGAGGVHEQRRPEGGINNALESLGDEGEIELDFSGFVNSETTPSARPANPNGKKEQEEPEEAASSATAKRSKEAGTTSKERFNYASFDCAATILKTSPGSKGATWILSENKDSYLINKCSEKNKYFIVELCNDILIDTIVLGNFEFFSSTFRHFRVSISDRYPVKADKWREIGTFEARNTRGVQAFLVENGLIWARYLKVELMTHYGKEYYCPVSLLRVHGKTMMDDYRNEMKEAQDPDDADDDDDEMIAETEDEHLAVSSTVPIPPMPKAEIEVLETASATTLTESTSSTATTTLTAVSTSHLVSTGSPANTLGETKYAPTSTWQGTLETEKRSRAYCEAIEVFLLSEPTSTFSTTSSTSQASNQPTQPAPGSDTPSVLPSTSPLSSHHHFSDSINATTTVPQLPLPTSIGNTTTMMQNSVGVSLTVPSSIGTTEDSAMVGGDSTSQPMESAANSTKATIQAQSTPQNSRTHTNLAQDSTTSAIANTISSDITGTTTASKTRSSRASQPLKAAPALPSTQDSFFRAVHKRLTMLESNSTLSLQYIEEQSRILREAFSKAEKRQMLKTSNFLETLNNTVLGELRNFRVQYDQIWQSTVLELASQREQSKREVTALGERLGLLADELVWQKRVVFLQFVLIVLCLGLVMFSKNGVASGSASAPLELSLLQSIQNLGRGGGASVSFAKRYPSSLESPPATPSRPNSMAEFFGQKSKHRRHLSDGITSGEETMGTGANTTPEPKQAMRLRAQNIGNETTIEDGLRSKSPSVHLQSTMPTPVSEKSDPLGVKDVLNPDHLSPEPDPAALKRAASSPPLGRAGDMIDEGQDEDVEYSTEGPTSRADMLQIPSLDETIDMAE